MLLGTVPAAGIFFSSRALSPGTVPERLTVSARVLHAKLTNGGVVDNTALTSGVEGVTSALTVTVAGSDDTPVTAVSELPVSASSRLAQNGDTGKR